MNCLYIHVGTHKTGTTTIQHSLRENEKKLKDTYNIYYPDINIVSKFNHYAHHEISHAIAGKSKKINNEQLKSFFIKISKELEKRNVILSAEPIYRHYLDNVEGDIWEQKKAYYNKLASLIPNNCQVLLILYIRQPDKFAVSMYSEKVLATRYNATFDEFLEEFDHHFDYNKNIEILKECISENIIIKPFDKSQFKDNDLLSDFYSIFNLDSNNFKSIGSKNSGLSRFYIEIKRIFNKCGYSRKDLNKLRNYFELLSEKQNFNFVPENSFFTEREAKAFNDKRYWPYPESYSKHTEATSYQPDLVQFICTISLVKSNLPEFSLLDLIDVTERYFQTFNYTKNINSYNLMFLNTLIPRCIKKSNKQDFYEYAKYLSNNKLNAISVIFFHELYYIRKMNAAIDELIKSYIALGDKEALKDISLIYSNTPDLISPESKKISRL